MTAAVQQPFRHTPYGSDVIPAQYRTVDAPLLGNHCTHTKVPPPPSPSTTGSVFSSHSLGASSQSSSVTDLCGLVLGHSLGTDGGGSSATTMPPLPPEYSATFVEFSGVTTDKQNTSNLYHLRPPLGTDEAASTVSSTLPSSTHHRASPSQVGGGSTAAAGGSDKRAFSFKAHYALAKVGVPYHQFPNGGVIPTPAHWPQHCTIDTNSSHPKTYRAFIGQVRFETPTEQIAWVLEQVTGVTTAFVAYHRNGCFVAHFLTEDDCATAVSHHKKILFDLNGVWDVNDTTSTPGASRTLKQVLKFRGNFHKHRLPRGCMVIEAFSSARTQQSAQLAPTD